MPKKQEPPQTHEDGEAQKLVERIEKKVRALPKRNLRVTQWVRTIPAVGVCTICNRQFKVPLASIKRVSEAQESLRVQFAEHKCRPEDRPL